MSREYAAAPQPVRGAAAASRTRGTCPQGHPYDAVIAGERRCRRCQREASRRYYHARVKSARVLGADLPDTPRTHVPAPGPLGLTLEARQARWQRCQQYLTRAGTVPAAIALAQREGFAAPLSVWVSAQGVRP